MRAQFALLRDALVGIWQLTQSQRAALFAIAVIAIGTAVAEALTIGAVLAVAGGVATGAPVAISLLGQSLTLELPAACVAALIAISVRALLQFANLWLNERMTEQVRYELRAGLIDAFLAASPADGSTHEELQTLATTYLDKGRSVITSLTGGIAWSVCALLLLAAALATDLVASAAFTVLVALTFVPSLAMTRRATRHSGTARQSLFTFAHSLSETALFRREAQSFGVTGPVRESLEPPLQTLNDSFSRAHFYQRAVPTLFLNVAMALLVGVMFITHHLGTAAPSTVFAVALLLRALQMAHRVQSALAAMATLYPFLRSVRQRTETYRRLEIPDGPDPVGDWGPLTLAGVHFRYGDDQPVVLDGVDLTIAPGEIVGLVGPSGAGKSTIIGLLMRHLTPDRGAITLGGTPIATFDRLSYARHIGFLPQECRLLSGGIDSNIRFFRALDDEVLERAARRAGVHDEIVALPEGYATPAGDLGGHLSGGQRQRVVLARAIAADPSLLILDEPTSALDAESEARVRASLEQLRADGTAVLIVAHRPSTVEICDRVFELRDGKLALLPPDA